MSSSGFSLFSLKKRIFALVAIFCVVCFLLVFRLFFIQVLSSEKLQKMAQDQWTRSLPIFAQRGEILDTNGQSLAKSESTYNLYSRAREIKNPSLTAEKIAGVLNKKFATIYDKVSDKSASEILLATNVSTEDAIKITKANLSGVYLTENSKRYYPFGNLCTQVLGFTTSDNQGQAGLELYYDQILKGKNGWAMVQSDLTGVSLENKLDEFLPAEKGSTLELTIDVNLQKIVEKQLEIIMVEQKAKSASGILMNAKTGEILAMSSKPSFDLNNVPRDNIEVLMDTVKNKMVVDVYEPGSTFKIITMAIALETGVASLTDRFFCPGYAIVDGEKIKCWKSIGHGSQSLAEGLANSCNCVFTSLAQRIGLTKFYDYLDRFGYGQPTGIEISGESGGILMKPSGVKVVDLARMGFGQAVAVTPIQQIVGVACAVNGGNLLQPYIVKSKTSASGEKIETSPLVKRQVVNSETSKILCDMLDLTVSMQTGKFTFVQGYAVGGKTGTTQKYENGGVSHNKYISSFVGVYPVTDPEYILLISVDEAMAGSYYGSIVASPYAKVIFAEMFDYYNIPPDDPSLAEKEPILLEMPYLVGMPLVKALDKLNELGVMYEISGEGDKIKSQLPAPTATIKITDTILIET